MDICIHMHIYVQKLAHIHKHTLEMVWGNFKKINFVFKEHFGRYQSLKTNEIYEFLKKDR